MQVFQCNIFLILQNVFCYLDAAVVDGIRETNGAMIKQSAPMVTDATLGPRC